MFRLVEEAASDVCVPYAVTVSASAADVLPVSFASPPYTAVMLCVPSVSDEVVYAATPLLLTATEPSVLVPSMNVTLPVGVPPFPVTVAVNVTELVTTTDGALETSFTAVVA